MRPIFKHTAAFLLAVTLAAPMLITGCAAHVRYYDAGYGDYHTWDHNEVVYYNGWERDTHRDHREFKDRSDAEKKEYWAYRHNKTDHH